MPTWPTSRSPRRIASPSLDRGLEPQAAQVAVRLALVVEAGDRLLADVAALGEADGALVDAGLLGDRRRRHLAPEARAAGLHPQDLGRRLGDVHGSAGCQQALQLSGRARGRSGRRRGRLRRRGSRRRRREYSRWACSPASGPAPDARSRPGPITDSSAQSPARPRSRPRGRPGTSEMANDALRTPRPRCRARRRPARGAGPACPPACGPCGRAARRSSRRPGSSASMSLVSCPWRNSAASGPRDQEHRSGRALQHACALLAAPGTARRARPRVRCSPDRL